MKSISLKFTIFLLVAMIFSCQQNEYSEFDKVMQEKLREIEKQENYNYWVTYMSDSVQARFYNRSNPTLIYHPYRYLRDTAKIEDLIKLTKASNPFIKSYAFSALEKRSYKNLYQIILSNLSDTTEFLVMSEDHGWYFKTIDLMLLYAIEELSNSQKDTLKELIITDYSNIYTMEDILLFFKPVDKHYQKVRKLAQEKNTFAKIALATYQKEKDVQIILNGLNNLNYYSGTLIYFKAIENFNHPKFFKFLIEYGESIQKYSSSGYDYMYFYYALAKYQNPKALEIFNNLLQEEYYGTKEQWYSEIVSICKALKKYKSKLYEPMINKLQKQIENAHDDYFLSTMDFYEEDYIDNSEWNY